MKLIKPSWEIIEQPSGIQGIYNHIELAGRTAYRSENKITEDSAKPFVDRMIKSGHLSVLEHGTVYLKYPYSVSDDLFIRAYNNNHYSKVRLSQDNNIAYISTNYRVIIENDWPEDLKYLCEPTEFHEKRVTVKFVADIHFYKDITRHRPMSYTIESTRFCNYLKEKFGMSVSFMEPTWVKQEDIPELEEDCKTIEQIYFKWINKGYQAQHAAYFLPQGTKAEIIMTGFVSDYIHIFNLRSSIAATGQPHPDVKALFDPLREEFIKKGYINE